MLLPTRDPVRVARLKFCHLAGDLKPNPPLQHKPYLLVWVGMHLHWSIGRELHENKHHLLARQKPPCGATR
jgi:hypothetical protein